MSTHYYLVGDNKNHLAVGYTLNSKKFLVFCYDYFRGIGPSKNMEEYLGSETLC